MMENVPSIELRCRRCGKRPEELEEYIDNAEMDGVTPTEWVLENERLLPNGREFYCTECYIKAGMPLW